MKKIALAAAVLMAATGAALAENPNVGGSDINAVAKAQIDSSHTSSVGYSAVHKLFNQGSNAATAQDRAVERRRTLFGDR